MDSSSLIDSIAELPVRQRAVPALAMVCALQSEAMQPFIADLFKGLRFCSLVNAGPSLLRWSKADQALSSGVRVPTVHADVHLRQRPAVNRLAKPRTFTVTDAVSLA